MLLAAKLSAIREAAVIARSHNRQTESSRSLATRVYAVGRRVGLDDPGLSQEDDFPVSPKAVKPEGDIQTGGEGRPHWNRGMEQRVAVGYLMSPSVRSQLRSIGLRLEPVNGTQIFTVDENTRIGAPVAIEIMDGRFADFLYSMADCRTVLEAELIDLFRSIAERNLGRLIEASTTGPDSTKIAGQTCNILAGLDKLGIEIGGQRPAIKRLVGYARSLNRFGLMQEPGSQESPSSWYKEAMGPEPFKENWERIFNRIGDVVSEGWGALSAELLAQATKHLDFSSKELHLTYDQSVDAQLKLDALQRMDLFVEYLHDELGEMGFHVSSSRPVNGPEL